MEEPNCAGMKKLLFLIAALLFLGQARTQVTDQGNFMIGSTLGFATSTSNIKQGDGTGEEKGEGPSVVQIHFAPAVGYFLIENMALGIRMDYTFNRQERTQTQKTKDSDLLFGPFARYYFPVGSDMAFLVEGGFGFGNSSDDTNIGGIDQSINTNIFSVGVGPGFTVISNEAIGLEALFKYTYSRSNFDTILSGVRQETVTRTNSFDISLGLHIYLSGIQRATTARSNPDFR